MKKGYVLAIVINDYVDSLNSDISLFGANTFEVHMYVRYAFENYRVERWNEAIFEAKLFDKVQQCQTLKRSQNLIKTKVLAY